LGRNKPALLGVLGAAGLGGIIWWQRRTSGGAGSSTDTQPTTGGGQAVFSSTGTDLATAIGNLGAGLQQQLADYTANLPQPAPLPAPAPAPAPKPAVSTPAPAAKATAHPKGWPWAVVGAGNKHQTVQGILEKFGLSLTSFRRLNPSITVANPQSGKKSKGSTAAKYSLITPGTRLRVG